MERHGRLVLTHPEGSLKHSDSLAECLPLHREEGTGRVGRCPVECGASYSGLGNSREPGCVMQQVAGYRSVLGQSWRREVGAIEESRAGMEALKNK